MRSGQLRHKLVFQTRSEDSDGIGQGGTVSWADTLTIRAEKWSVSGKERIEAARTKQNTIYRWHLRYNPAIVPSMRIKWVDGSVTHYQEALSVNPLGNKGRELEVIAEEKI